jgi:AraC family transcriptional regulator, arabinose operon regulatory protein
MAVKRRRIQEEPPFEDEIFTWREWSRTFKDIIFAPMLLRDRRKWMASSALAGFRVFSCGHYVVASGLFAARSGLNEGIYIYNVAGKGFYRCSGQTWPIRPGELLYCAPRTAHEYWSDAEDPWTIHWMHVSGRNAGRYARAIGFAADNPVIQIGIQAEIVHLFHMLYELVKPCFERQRAFAIQSCAQLILSRIALAPRSAFGSYAQVRDAQEIQGYMERVVDQRLGLGHFAARLGVSLAHFSRVFKQHTQFAPIEYFRRLKIHKACSLLATTRCSVKEIALQLSFDDQNYFSRLFKNIMGMSPIAYRRGVLKSGRARTEKLITTLT